MLRMTIIVKIKFGKSFLATGIVVLEGGGEVAREPPGRSMALMSILLRPSPRAPTTTPNS